MKYLYTGKEAKKIDSHAIQAMGIPGLVLMERAAMSAAALLMKKEPADTRILAVCGSGNNGGDAVAAARILYEQGYKTAVTVVGPEAADGAQTGDGVQTGSGAQTGSGKPLPQADGEQLLRSVKLSDDMRRQLSIAMNTGVPVLPPSSISEGHFDVILDGLFGVGLSREVTGVYRQAVDAINGSGARCYAIDIPSGVSADTGKILGAAVQADCTITFGVNKLGLVLCPGCQYAGEVFVMDIGFPSKSVASAAAHAHLYEHEDLNRMPGRAFRSNKGTFGHVLVAAGSKQMSGACFFAAKAAYRAGAGLVRVVTVPENRQILLSAIPEILFSERTEIKEALEWADAVVLGPGIGLDREAEEMVRAVLEGPELPTVIDGDALRILPKAAERLSGRYLLTPHLKEMTYLADGKTVEDIAGNLYRQTADTAARWGCVVAAKDARTLVSDGSDVYVNVSGNNGMATGGSGDVLAGLCGGLLAQHMEVYDAARLAVFLHGLAGDDMAEKKSTYSLMASDLLEGVASVLSRVQAGERGQA